MNSFVFNQSPDPDSTVYLEFEKLRRLEIAPEDLAAFNQVWRQSPDNSDETYRTLEEEFTNIAHSKPKQPGTFTSELTQFPTSVTKLFPGQLTKRPLETRTYKNQRTFRLLRKIGRIAAFFSSI